MAESDLNAQSKSMDNENDEKRLKYLEFIQVATLHSILVAAKLYNFAKENSGPLKPSVDSVEGSLKNVVSPLYDKYGDVPVEFLKFMDRKVDESVNKMQSSVPTTLKQVSARALEKAQKAPQAARSVVAEVKNIGLVETASGLAKTAYSKCEPAAKQMYSKYEPAAKQMYSKYEPVAEQYAASAWQTLNKLPLVPRVSKAVAPTAGYCSEKYNQTVQLSAEKGYRVASYLPLVPTEKIVKMLAVPVASGGA